MKQFTLEQKKQLRDKLIAMLDCSGLSANEFAVKRLGFKNGSKLSHIRNNWDKDGMVGLDTWEAVEKYIIATEEYKLVPTANLKKVWHSCQRAYQLKKNIHVIGEGGFGKTAGLESFKRHIEATQTYKIVYFDASMINTRKQFIAGLMDAIGCYKPGTISSQLLHMREYARKQDMLIQIDEVSSLKGHNVTIIKDVMTAFKDIVGIVFAGTPYFKNNLTKGALRDRHLYSETRDRLFMLPELLTKPTATEAKEIFVANGITDKAELDILLGNKKEFQTHSWLAKQTFRGIRDCIDMIKMAEEPQFDFDNIQL